MGVLFKTADLGGGLVYEHGLGVQARHETDAEADTKADTETYTEADTEAAHSEAPATAPAKVRIDEVKVIPLE